MFYVKIGVIANGLEKYMTFTKNRNIIFIDSMQFMNCSLDSLVFKYLSEEYSGQLLKLVKEKGVHPYEYVDTFLKIF